MSAAPAGRRTAAVLVSLAILAACGGEDPTGTPPTPGIEVSYAGAATVAQGSNATTDVFVQRKGGYSGPVTLTVEALPAGIVATFTGSPQDAGLPAQLQAAESGARLTFFAAASAPTGAKSYTLRASGTGIPDASAPGVLTVAAQ